MKPKLLQAKCPICDRMLGNINSNADKITLRCKSCNKVFEFNFKENEINRVKRPDRVTSSGMTFY